jgi:epoxyqueuosine reductase
MENHFDKRLDPTLLVEDTSVISLLLNYYPVEQQIQNSIKYLNMPMVDYHLVKDKLKELLYSIQESIGAVSGRAFVDSAPVLDKAWAAGRFGLDGKNSNL